MQHKDFNSKTVTHFLNRIANVEKDTKRRWGTMTPAQMFAHVSLGFEGSLGELPIEGNGKIPFKWLKPIVLSGLLPFPKNGKAPPVFITDNVGSVAEERERLQKSIKRFLGQSEKEPGRLQVNPLFGPMTMTQWARLHCLHLNHHLDQFGV